MGEAKRNPAVITLLRVIGYFPQTFNTFFVTEHDPVLIGIERIKDQVKQGETGSEPPAPSP